MRLSRVARTAAVLACLAFSSLAAAQTEPESVAFVVRHVERRPAGEFVLTFENGEVWQQDDRNKKISIERGEQVVIRRSANGRFTLVARDGQSTRVKRVH